MRKAMHYQMISGTSQHMLLSGRRRSTIVHTPFSRYNAKLQNKPINSAHIVLQVPGREPSAQGRHFIAFKDGDGAQQEVGDASKATCKVGLMIPARRPASACGHLGSLHHHTKFRKLSFVGE